MMMIFLCNNDIALAEAPIIAYKRVSHNLLWRVSLHLLEGLSVCFLNYFLGFSHLLRSHPKKWGHCLAFFIQKLDPFSYKKFEISRPVVCLAWLFVIISEKVWKTMTKWTLQRPGKLGKGKHNGVFIFFLLCSSNLGGEAHLDTWVTGDGDEEWFLPRRYHELDLRG